MCHRLMGTSKPGIAVVSKTQSSVPRVWCVYDGAIFSTLWTGSLALTVKFITVALTLLVLTLTLTNKDPIDVEQVQTATLTMSILIYRYIYSYVPAVC